MNTKLTRRALAKQIAMVGAATAASPIRNATAAEQATPAQAAWTQVYPGIWRARIGTPETFTPVTSRLVSVKEEAFRHLPSVAECPLEAPQASISSRGCELSLPLRTQEGVYGLGLQFLSFAQRGKKKVVRVNADPKFDTGDSHAPVPFYVTTNGVGILVDTARYATFYFGNARLKPQQPVASATNANPDPNYSHNIQDADPGRVTIEVPRASGVDVYLFAGPSMLDAVRRYNVFSGGGVLPPEWGLGFWYRADARATADTALALADELRQRNIPCDVFGLEPGWQTHAYSCTFVWEPTRFADPTAFLKQMAARNYKVNLWEHAYTHPASPLFSQLKNLSADYGVWGGLVPDFANPEARQRFGEYHAKTFLDAGVSGFKLDECDNSDYTGGWSFPELSRFPSGVDGEQMHNVFGLRYQQALWDAFRSRKRETYSLVRSSGALAAPYPFVLYSDLYNHRDFIRALVNSGFGGVLWCPEVRDAESEEDLIRRLQSVVFSPLAMVNGWYIKSPPWKQLNRDRNNAGELMPNWESLEARCREIIGWRMSLVPYLLRAFEQYQQDGTPPFRAVIMDHPQDAALLKVDDQYLVGDRMMIAPLFANEATRKIVFPAGEDWHDFWTGKRIPGGSTITLQAADTRDIPAYVRTGSIVPWAEVGLHAGTPQSRRIAARVYGDGSRSFHLPASSAQLTWKNNKGTVQGTSPYTVPHWTQLG